MVHRSTLVTAGLVFIINFSSFFSVFELSIILIFGLFTMFFSSILALLEEDIKKLVALSTLSQIGFSVFIMGLGLRFVSLFHLISHAIFKRCLFIQIGYIIICSFGQQDGRGYTGINNIPFFIQLQFLLTLFCLCGLFFFSGCVSKDIILSMMFVNSFFILLGLLFVLIVFFTFIYRIRL